MVASSMIHCVLFLMTTTITQAFCIKLKQCLFIPEMALVEQLKQHVAKRSLQRSLNNQILDYKAILDLCENEMILIKFFGICKKSMISVEHIKIEK